MHWYLEVLEKYAVFTGRSRRAEYWYFQLFNFLIGFALVFTFSFLGGVVTAMAGADSRAAATAADGVYILYALATFLPALGVLVRRLHDTGRSGWWVLIGFLPFVGGIVLLVFCIQDGEPGPNQYGSNPKAGGGSF